VIIDIDIETRSPCDLKKCGLAKYARHPETEILCMVLKSGEPIWQTTPDELSELAKNPDTIWRAHNAAFEKENLKHRLGIDIPISQWRCSAALAASYNLPRSLGAVGAALNLSKQKDDSGKKLMLKMCKPLPIRQQKNNEPEMPNYLINPMQFRWDDARYHMTRESIDGLVRYCFDDVLSEEAIFDRLGELPEFEQKLWERDYIINFENGVPLDVDLCQAALTASEKIVEDTVKACEEKVGFSPRQVAKLAEFCGLPDGTADTVRDALATDTLTDDQRYVLDARQIAGNTSVRKYQSALNMACEDNRAYGTMLYHGASQTGRWAGRGLQVQNFPRGNFSELWADEDMELTCARITRGEEVSMDDIKSATRGMIRGNLAMCDYSAIEARVLAWMAGQQDVLDAFIDGKDLYKVAAQQIYGVPYDQVDKSQRQIGKIAVLALGYQGGKGAFRGMAEVYGLTDLDDEFCQTIVKGWRKSNDKIVSLWYKYQDDAINAITYGGRHGNMEVIDGFLHSWLPSGRSIKYYSPELHEDPKFGNVSVTFVTEPTLTDKIHSKLGNGLARVYTYSGKLVQGCLSSDTEILTACGWVKITDHKPGMPLFDGEEWVNGGELVDKGIKRTIILNGVRLTPDHKILDEHGEWHEAEAYTSQGDRPNRSAVRLPEGYRDGELWGRKGSMEVQLPELRRVLCTRDIRAKEKTWAFGEVVRMPKGSKRFKGADGSWYVEAPYIPRMGHDVGSVLPQEQKGLPQLWRAWDKGVSCLARVQAVFSGHGSELPKGVTVGSDGQRQGLQSRQLPMGNTNGEREQHEGERLDRHTRGSDDRCTSIEIVRDRADDITIPNITGCTNVEDVHDTRCYEQVWDIMNCGPRNRFVIRGGDGVPMIAHNCTQATARDLLADAVMKLPESAVNLLVHDEIVSDTVSYEDLRTAMLDAPKWAEGLPLDVDGFECPRYRK
jgi:DNA polymerase